MKKILYILTVVIGLVACKSVDMPKDQQSGVKFNVVLNGAFNDDTKAPVNDDYPMELSNLRAVVKNGQDTIATYENMAKMPPVYFLDPSDNYSIMVETNGNRNEINAVPYYYGETQFVVKEGVLVSLQVNCTIECMAVSITFVDALTELTSYKLSYYDIYNSEKTIFEVTQAQNQPNSMKVYMDNPFAFGIRIEGRLKGKKWLKNVIQHENILNKTYHNLSVN